MQWEKLAAELENGFPKFAENDATGEDLWRWAVRRFDVESLASPRSFHRDRCGFGLYFIRQFRKRQVFYPLRKAHPHPGELEQIGALFGITGTLRKDNSSCAFARYLSVAFVALLTGIGPSPDGPLSHSGKNRRMP